MSSNLPAVGLTSLGALEWRDCVMWQVALSPGLSAASGKWQGQSGLTYPFGPLTRGHFSKGHVLSLGEGKCHLLEAPVWKMFCPRKWSLQMGNLKGNFVGNFWSPLCADIEKTVKCRGTLVPFIVSESACYILWFCTSMPAV